MLPLSFVFFEAHHSAATIYVVGWLGEAAAAQTDELVRALPAGIRSLRLDLSAVEMIDPGAFVRVARSARRWREGRGDRVSLELPAGRPGGGHHLRPGCRPHRTGRRVDPWLTSSMTDLLAGSAPTPPAVFS